MINVNTDKYKNVLELLEDEHLMDLEFYVRENKQLKELISFMQIEIDRLTSNDNSDKTGRKSKLSEFEKTQILIYKIQGKTIKELATLFNCSERTINRALKSRKE
ncbi:MULTISPECIES: helix-turn-helix domain-containing protein [Clostridium]|jgi:Fic family protein|uniref:helix-turn-helix domain-containing protein n=1 Tax=Clostridium TaxID=1485 RepID=UPI0005FAAD0D|nr:MULTISPECIES: helix-turn-helix domain-containing protein [Clostridium]MDU2897128.1 helix-turn-helix domain-containing protein [Clostridium sp.]MDU3009289.1 helix-turn-helix domain-containing protein [Clostridium sp.]MDU3039441.1 helix-turn-helix domain-containing protein [Clostridium sp.]